MNITFEDIHEELVHRYFNSNEPTNLDELKSFIEDMTGKAITDVEPDQRKTFLKVWDYFKFQKWPLIRKRKVKFNELISHIQHTQKTGLFHCSIDYRETEGNYTGGYIKPTAKVNQLIAENMLPDLGLHFKIIVLKNEIRFFAEYDQIIGSRLLALIDRETMPNVIDWNV